MNTEKMGDKASPSATEDMLADLGVSGAHADQLRALLGDVAGLAHEVPEPSDDVRALLGGSVPLRARRRTVIVAAAVGALALGGVSAAAATNRLPDRVQEIAADATRGVVPHPVKPSDPPNDAPGHIVNKPKPTKTPKPKPKDSKAPRPLNTTAPGQIQKLTKPDPAAVGPAHPADPGSHGRAHNDADVNADDKVKIDGAGDNDDAGSGSGRRKPD